MRLIEKNRNVMKKLVSFLTIVLLAAISATAQTPQGVIDKCLSSLGKGAVSASYSVAGQGATSGTIVLSGKKFRMISPQLKCWYDGKTMWTYSQATGEVNITTPTAADLAMTNPYAIAQSYKQSFTMSKGTSAGGAYTIKMAPKKKSNIKELTLTINTKSYRITKVQFLMTNKSKTTITVSNYKTGVKTDAKTFKFDKSFVPKGTPVVDLR